MLGIEYVRNAKRPDTSEVRYYRMADRETAVKIADILSKAGERSIKPMYLKQYENDPSVRPNHYEVWFRQPMTQWLMVGTLAGAQSPDVSLTTSRTLSRQTPHAGSPLDGSSSTRRSALRCRPIG